MYLNAVIGLVNKYYPNEYEPGEMYLWCDEVSAKLLVEERKMYREKLLNIEPDGAVLLPEDVDIENVERVIVNDRELKKQDIRFFDTRPVFSSGKRTLILPERPRTGSLCTVSYLVPYRPVRLVKYQGYAYIDKDNDEIAVQDNEFIPGDILRLSIDESVINDIPLMGVEYLTAPSESESKPILAAYSKLPPERGYILKCAEGSLKDAAETESESAVLRRRITEETVCQAPFDKMYVEYLLAKICQYQRDWGAYDRYFSSFLTTLEEYRRWLGERMPIDDGKVLHWW